MAHLADGFDRTPAMARRVRPRCAASRLRPVAAGFARRAAVGGPPVVPGAVICRHDRGGRTRDVGRRDAATGRLRVRDLSNVLRRADGCRRRQCGDRPHPGVRSRSWPTATGSPAPRWQAARSATCANPITSAACCCGASSRRCGWPRPACSGGSGGVGDAAAGVRPRAQRFANRSARHRGARALGPARSTPSRQARWLLCLAPLTYALFWLGMSAWADLSHHVFGAETRFSTNGDVSSSRFAIWSNTLALIRAHPWSGVGFGEFNFAWTLTPFPDRPVAFFDHTHNLALHLAVELGIPLTLVVRRCSGGRSSAHSASPAVRPRPTATPAPPRSSAPPW